MFNEIIGETSRVRIEEVQDFGCAITLLDIDIYDNPIENEASAMLSYDETKDLIKLLKLTLIR